MNFISTFEELNKLYEEVEGKKVKHKAKLACTEEKTDGVDEGLVGNAVGSAVGTFVGNKLSEKACEEPKAEKTEAKEATENSPEVKAEEGFVGSAIGSAVGTVVGNKLSEEAEEDEIEVVDDEAAAEEPRQVIIECDKCGAIVLKDDSDIVMDDESDLVNVKDECQFCEETAGYNIIGIVAPYNPDEVDVVTEDLADWYRKKFDKPASISTQQDWEDELNGEPNEKRRKHLERKFAQQRDWEARHPEKDPVRAKTESVDGEELDEA